MWSFYFSIRRNENVYRIDRHHIPQPNVKCIVWNWNHQRLRVCRIISSQRTSQPTFSKGSLYSRFDLSNLDVVDGYDSRLVYQITCWTRLHTAVFPYTGRGHLGWALILLSLHLPANAQLSWKVLLRPFWNEIIIHDEFHMSI